MFWSGGRLERELDKIVIPFNKKSIDCSAYTLAIGRQVYISPDGDSNKSRKIINLHRLESFEIPPGQFAFIITDEILNIPKDVLAFINTKSKVKLRGLINISGFHVDPGYFGRIIFSVYNAGPSPIMLRQGDAFGLIWFSNTDVDFGSHYKSGAGYMTIASEMVTQVPGSNLSLEVLSNRIDTLQRRLIITILLLAVPVLGAVSVAIFQVVYQKWLG